MIAIKMILFLKNYYKKITLKNFKKQLFQCFFDPQSITGKQCDYCLNCFIILSTLCLILETSYPDYEMFFALLEWLFTIIFTIEYILKIYCLKKKSNYIYSFFGIIDLIAIIPTYISVFFPGILTLLGVKSLKFLRILRIFKFLGYLEKVYF